MATKARIENGVVAELLTASPFPPFHPSLVWVDCDTGVSVGFTYDGAAFSAPQTATPSRPPIAPISPRQIRMALTRAGLRALVETAVSSGDRDLKDWWEFSTSYERTNPQVVAMGLALNQTDESLDALWKLGATL